MDWDPTSRKIKNEKSDPYIKDRNWDDYFTIAGEFHSHDFSNQRQIRVMILTGTKVDESEYDTKNKIYTAMNYEELKDDQAFTEDCARIKILEQNPTTNRIIFKVFNLSLYFPNARNLSKTKQKINAKKMLQDIKDFWPTMIILPFSSTKFANFPVPMDYRDFGFKYNCLDIVEELINHKILQELIIKNKNCMFFRSKNMFLDLKNMQFVFLIISVCNILCFISSSTMSRRLYLKPKSL